MTVPELTDEFVAGIGDYASAEEYKIYIKSLVEEDNKKSEASENEMRVWEVVYNGCEFHGVPETEVNTYRDKIINQYTAYAESNSMELEEFVTTYLGTDYDTFEAQVKAISESQVKQELIIYSIVHAEKLRLTDKEYDEGIAELAESNNTTVESLEQQAEFSELWKAIMPGKVLSFLLDNAVAATADSDTEAALTTTAASKTLNIAHSAAVYRFQMEIIPTVNLRYPPGLQRVNDCKPSLNVFMVDCNTT